jgi:hypothetical protein
MLVVKAPKAGCASEEDIVCIIDARRIHDCRRINAVIFITCFLLLGRCSAAAKRSTAETRFATILAFALIGRCGVLLSRECNTSTALKNKVVLANLGDKMFSVCPVSQA